jgi:hypothetical protein
VLFCCMIQIMDDDLDTIPASLIDEPIEVVFEKEPTYEKCPDCPSAFVWRGKTNVILRTLNERQDFKWRGRFGNNMAPAHLSTAERMGSWGVGRYNFCVEVEGGKIYEIYYDRAPQNAGDRKGHWILKGERTRKDRQK